jgi:dihydrofolate synthase / folylpolyglutamate synthase
MNYQECVEYLFGLHRFGIRLGLEKMQRLCQELGHPQRRLKFIHLAGTNGKGSVAALLESVLRSAGYRTGLYTSPHLVEMGERIRVGGEMIARDEMIRQTEQIRSLMKSCPELRDLSFFEVLTAIALRHFAESQVDLVVWETGLGGRLDATNVVEPECCVITGIGYDHQEYLGDTLEKIALEKAGILKPGKVLVLQDLGCDQEQGREMLAASRVIKNRAEELGCPVETVGQEARQLVQRETTSELLEFKYQGLTWGLGLKGIYQIDNALLALKVCEVLQSQGWNIPEAAKKNGLAQAEWPGRFDILSQNPAWVLDGGHNVQGLQSALLSWRHWFKCDPEQIIFGCVAEKDLNAMAEQFTRNDSTIHLVMLSTARSQTLECLQAAFCGRKVMTHGSVGEAMAHCKKNGKSTLIIGSLYLVGEVLALLKNHPHELKLNG